MRSPRALLTVFLAIAMLGVAAFDDIVPMVLSAVGMDTDGAAALAPTLRLAIAALGFVVLAASIGVLVGSVRHESNWEPYVAALQGLAFEHGKRVREDERGLSLSLIRDTLRLEVRLEEGRLQITAAFPARQALTFCKPGVQPGPPPPDWRRVGSMDRWELYAELPAMARPLLSEVALLSLLDRYFGHAQAERITHVLLGLRIEEALPPSWQVDARIRAAADVAHALKRFNG